MYCLVAGIFARLTAWLTRFFAFSNSYFRSRWRFVALLCSCSECLDGQVSWNLTTSNVDRIKVTMTWWLYERAWLFVALDERLLLLETQSTRPLVEKFGRMGELLRKGKSLRLEVVVDSRAARASILALGPCCGLTNSGLITLSSHFPLKLRTMQTRSLFSQLRQAKGEKRKEESSKWPFYLVPSTRHKSPT